MAIVSVPYMVEVRTLVDTDDGRVTRVVVIDEGVELDEGELAYWEVTPEIDDEDERARVIDQAVAIAEREDWPGWEFGF